MVYSHISRLTTFDELLNMKNKTKLKVLAISSLPTVGNAGLKNIIGILGGHVLPVPTLIISGLGNMAGHQRFTLPYKDVLEQTCWMAQQQGYSLVVYTGYFHQAKQIQETIHILEKYQEKIHTIIVDPVSGDNGKPYVKPEIIKALPKLAILAHWLVPNETELKLLLNLPMETTLEETLRQFKTTYPTTKLLVTGIKKANRIGNFLMTEKENQLIEHSFYPKHYSGTGDTFTALFIRYHFFKQMSVHDAVEKAGHQLAHFIYQSMSIQIPSFDLMLDIDDG